MTSSCVGRYLSAAVAILKNRNFLLLLAIALGIAFGQEAQFTRPTVLPALAVALTVSITRIPVRTLLSPRALARPMLLAVTFNYIIHGAVLLLLARWLVPNENLWIGFVLLAAVPPAVAVVPYSYLLAGDTRLSLIGLAGAYVAGLVITPVMVFLFIGQRLIDPTELATVLLQLILVPVVLSRLLLLTSIDRRLDRWRGGIVNWMFFLVVFTVVGLNRDVFLEEYGVLAVLSLIGVASTFVLGYAIELVLDRLNVERSTTLSLLLLGTLKNYGMASAIALALFSAEAAAPAAVLTTFGILYFIWLGLRVSRRSP